MLNRGHTRAGNRRIGFGLPLVLVVVPSGAVSAAVGIEKCQCQEMIARASAHIDSKEKVSTTILIEWTKFSVVMQVKDCVNIMGTSHHLQ